MKKALLGMVGVTLAAASPTFAAVISFDDQNPSTILTTQYQGQGVTFSGARVLGLDTQSGNLNPNYPPNSGLNVVYDYLNGVITATANGADWTQAGGYITGDVAITLEAYDSSNNLLGSVSTPGANEIGAGTGYDPNIYLSLSFSDISYVKFHDTGNTFTLDDFTFTTVPEPSTWAAGALMLLPFGFGLLRMLRKRHAA